jgi:hypothetical protein
MNVPKKAKQYGLNRGEQLYIFDQIKIIALHNYFIQNFIVQVVLPRLGLDATKVNVVLTENLQGILVRPVDNQVSDQKQQPQVNEQKVEQAQAVNKA